MTSKIVEIVPPFQRQRNGIPSAAIRWPDFGDRSSFGRPFAQIYRHSDTPLLSFHPPGEPYQHPEYIYNVMILIPKSVCVVVKSQGYLGNAGLIAISTSRFLERFSGAFLFVEERRLGTDEKSDEHTRQGKLDQGRGESATANNEKSGKIEKNQQVGPGHNRQGDDGDTDKNAEQRGYIYLWSPKKRLRFYM